MDIAATFTWLDRRSHDDGRIYSETFEEAAQLLGVDVDTLQEAYTDARWADGVRDHGLYCEVASSRATADRSMAELQLAVRSAA